MEDEQGKDAEQAPGADAGRVAPEGDRGAAGGRPPSDEERAALLREELKALRLVDVAQDMMLSLVTVGYQKLGLTDETRDLRDLDDARLAIELLRGMIEAVAAASGETSVAPYRSTLAAMQLNYARVAVPAAAAEQPPHGEEAGPGVSEEGAPGAEAAGSREQSPPGHTGAETGDSA